MHLMHDKMHNCIDTGFFRNQPVAQVALILGSPSGPSSAGPRQPWPASGRQQKTRQLNCTPKVGHQSNQWGVFHGEV
jgi:hypothetical protein